MAEAEKGPGREKITVWKSKGTRPILSGPVPLLTSWLKMCLAEETLQALRTFKQSVVSQSVAET